MGRANAYVLSILFRSDLLDEDRQTEQRELEEQMLTRFLLRAPGQDWPSSALTEWF